MSTEVIHGINIKKEKNNPTYATISPADLTSFNSIDKTYLNFVKITIIDQFKKLNKYVFSIFTFNFKFPLINASNQANLSLKLISKNMPARTTTGGR